MIAKLLIGLVVFGGIVAVLSNISGTITFFQQIKDSKSLKWLRGPMGGKKPRRLVTLVIIPEHNVCTWQEGGRYGQNHMLVVCSLNVTNTGPTPVAQIVDAYLQQPITHPSHYINPNIPYTQGIATNAVFNFEVEPVGTSGQPWTAVYCHPQNWTFGASESCIASQAKNAS